MFNEINMNTKEELSMKVDGFLYCHNSRIPMYFSTLNRKMLQFRGYITELLNVCYISVNTLDIIKKKNKIIVSKRGRI